MHSIIRDILKGQLKKVPQIRPGYTVKVGQKIKEGNKERIQYFEGLVIKVSSGEGIEKTFTLRKIVEGVGVEKVFPIHSPNLAEISVRKKAKVRRSKLYYMRTRSGKSARLTEQQVSDDERAKEMASVEEAMGNAKSGQAVESSSAEEMTSSSDEAPASEASEASEASAAEMKEEKKDEEAAA